MRVLDLFCGAGGASVGLHLLGADVIGIDHDPDACRTHLAAGWPTIRADLTRPLPTRGDFDMLWASPPCTAFSMAGKGEGRELADQLIGSILAERFDPWPDVDPAIWLVLPTLASALEVDAPVMCWENVPQTQPVMDAVAQVLERHGYRATTVVLSSECFGVAQTRKRCFLIASKTGYTLPEPTHQTYRHGEPASAESTLFGTLASWVSMAEALGWGTPERPYWVIPTAGGNRGGADEMVGGSGARRSLYEHADRESWVLDRRCQQRAADGGREAVPPVPTSSPSLTVSGVSGQFVWTQTRPATTVAADQRPSPPGWRGKPSDYDADGTYIGERSMDNAIRLTIGEAARLQAFPADHPWQGSRTSTFRQIGNAVPPPVAAAVAGAALGIDWQPLVADYLADLYASPTEVEAAA